MRYILALRRKLISGRNRRAFKREFGVPPTEERERAGGCFHRPRRI